MPPASAYSNRFLTLAYRRAGRLYDLLVWWAFLPLGGERACRLEFARWLDVRPGHRVASLCCGTGSMEPALLAEQRELSITGVDLGEGQIRRARQKNQLAGVSYLLGDARRTGLAAGEFDRVLIVLALHEMNRPDRLSVLGEARRLCTATGRVLAIEHARPSRRASRLLQSLWWFLWVPGNPETKTSRDLQRHGLAREMAECGLTVLERHTTHPDWIEACLAAPRDPSSGDGTSAKGSVP